MPVLSPQTVLSYPILRPELEGLSTGGRIDNARDQWHALHLLLAPNDNIFLRQRQIRRTPLMVCAGLATRQHVHMKIEKSTALILNIMSGYSNTMTMILPIIIHAQQFILLWSGDFGVEFGDTGGSRLQMRCRE